MLYAHTQEQHDEVALCMRGATQPYCEAGSSCTLQQSDTTLAAQGEAMQTGGNKIFWQIQNKSFFVTIIILIISLLL